MKFHAAVCPQCSGNLQLPDDKDVVKCMYCGVDVVFRDAVQSSKPSIESLTQLAESAMRAGRYAEAHGYYTKILESDPKSYVAWIGKGAAAGWQSNLLGSRFGELKECFDQAIKFVEPESIKANTKTDCAVTAYQVAKAYFDVSLQHTMEFIGVPSAIAEHRDRVKETIELCRYSLNLNPKATGAGSFIADIASRQIKNGGLTDHEKSYFSIAKKQYEEHAPSQEGKSDGNGYIIFGFIVSAFIAYVLLTNVFGVKNSVGVFFGTFFLASIQMMVVLYIVLSFVYGKAKRGK